MRLAVSRLAISIVLGLALAGGGPALAQTPPDSAAEEAVTPPPGQAKPKGAGDEAAKEAEPALPRVSVAVSVTADDGRETALGTFVIELYPDLAPQHVENFLKLVDEEFYVGTTFHRIVPAFIVQGGDLISKRNWSSSKLGTGADGPEYTLPAEIGGKHERGAVAAARKPDAVNPNRESSPTQFYICLANLPALDQGGYTVFGKVIQGMEVVDKIARVKNTGPPRNQALQKIEMIAVRRVQ